jgi:5-methylcytosine-specific restriction endonuclease McrA
MSEPVIMSRIEAKAAGLARYFTGKPCKHGHVAERYASTCVCVTCQRQNNAAYLPAYASARSDDLKAYMNSYYRSRRDEFVQRAREWKKANPEKARASNAASVKRNIDAVRARTRNRRAALRTAGSHSAADVRAIYSKQKGKCAYCRRSVGRSYHVDHVMPIKLGGENYRTNLQITCPECNVRKGASHPIDFAQSIGLLI